MKPPPARHGRGWAALSIVAIAAALTATGCGSSRDALPRDEWIGQADAICARLADELRALPEPQTTEQAGEIGRDVVEITSRNLAELRALRPTEAEAASVDELLDAFDDVLEVSSAWTTALIGDDETALRDILPRLEESSRNAERLAAQYGLEVCGQADE